ncbi:hypothetical protein EIN_066040 [Entamoeba invadens IP1]|uniref:Uncharacterized protein n=1 Tax=Entamoeba invadens IP1 TaxID=370355 RepID=A0A0A1TVC1_ENTIV|nr:hypothetical protein EIN_066040 [Entamoeba invadens IP1]ELP84319.1 hypothetical protein EIN_066040 [Entamoeba invadens IP1]|eukprot:XP_004183665.1 hypothetical protein EIN_066040 [Entamoeba invadens IP1]
MALIRKLFKMIHLKESENELKYALLNEKREKCPLLFKNIIKNFESRMSEVKMVSFLESLVILLNSENGGALADEIVLRHKTCASLKRLIKRSQILDPFCQYVDSLITIQHLHFTYNTFKSEMYTYSDVVEYIRLCSHSWTLLSNISLNQTVFYFENPLLRIVFYEQCILLCKTLNCLMEVIKHISFATEEDLESLIQSINTLENLKYLFTKKTQEWTVQQEYGKLSMLSFYQMSPFVIFMKEMLKRKRLGKQTKKQEIEIHKYLNTTEYDFVNNVVKVESFVSFRYRKVYIQSAVKL